MRCVRAGALALLCVSASFAQQAVMRQYSVSTLPSASANNGIMAQIKDGAGPLDCSTGGGAFVVNCVSNGTTWIGESAAAAASSTLIINNASSTGTSPNKLAKVTGSPTSTAVISTTSDTSGLLGIVIAGSGTSGPATIQTYGLVQAVFDGGTTAGDYVVASTTVNGDVHDTGSSTYPTTGVQVLGRALTNNGSLGTYQMYLFASEVHGYATNTALKLTGSVSVTPGSVVDGACSQQGTTLTISGAAVGDPISVGVNAALAANINVFGKVTSANTVTFEICNSSGQSVTPPAGTYWATIVH
jgi:hypothetical protein